MNIPFKQWSAWTLVLFWMGVIFYLSHQPADESSALSAGIVEQLIAFFETITGKSFSDTDWMHYFIRKGAHLFAYFLLAILLMYAWLQAGWRGANQIIGTLVICVLYATSDEIHQLFIPGRSGEITDVLIDSVGASIGIFTFLIIHKSLQFFRKHKKST